MLASSPAPLRRHWRLLTLLTLLLSCLGPGPALASEREFLLEWIAPDDPVDGFRLYVGEAPGEYLETLDLGFVAADDDGLTRETLLLDDSADLYLALTAYNAAGESPLSNEIVVEAPLTVEAVVPGAVVPGSALLEIHGSAFGAATSLHFENGSGPAPTVAALRVLDAQTLVAEVRVRAQGPPRARLWDVVVEDPELGTARLEDGLRVEP